jgi:hypothetical protein
MIPKSNTPEASFLIEEVMKERQYPCNPTAAARAGYEAAYREMEKKRLEANSAKANNTLNYKMGMV